MRRRSLVERTGMKNLMQVEPFLEIFPIFFDDGKHDDDDDKDDGNDESGDDDENSDDDDDEVDANV